MATIRLLRKVSHCVYAVLLGRDLQFRKNGVSYDGGTSSKSYRMNAFGKHKMKIQSVLSYLYFKQTQSGAFYRQ